MREPIKIIHKYKNSNNFIGYKTYIFVGNVSNNIKNIFSDIENLSLENTLKKLDKSAFELLINNYGQNWYYLFFNKHHIISSKNKLKKNKEFLNTLKKKFSSVWVNKHFEDQEFILKPSHLDKYADYIKNKRVVLKQLKNSLKQSKNSKQIGGDNDDVEEQVDEDEFIFEEDTQKIIESNLDDLDFNFDTISVDNNIKETNKKIKEVLSKSKIKSHTEFSLDDNKNQDNEEINNVFNKIFIYTNFIFFDDTINKIKSKISNSISLNNFDNNYLIPSRLYLWTEYFTKEMKIDKVALGSKWIKKTELWNIDIEPKNDINQYINLTSKSLQDLNYAYKKYNNRIKREDDSQLVLFEYNDYMTNNELYMIDVYTQLNLNITIPENKLVNLINTFIRIYFPETVFDIQDIIAYLQTEDSVNKQNEIKKLDFVYKSINNDLLLENEVIELIENTKVNNKMFYTPYITQTVVHLKLHNNDLLNLRKIFDNFILDDKYPFLQLQLSHEKPIRKILKNKYFSTIEETKQQALNLKNWLQNNSYGLTIKVLAFEDESYTNRYLTITITELGKVQYKIQWKEENKTTVENISKTFIYISSLIDKINKENDISLPFPHIDEFKYIFINSIQQYEFTSKAKINHNDLSNFARLFYPYIAVVIEPKKRVAKDNIKTSNSKWGTYLRFKKVSNYEDEISMNKRIIYYLKNFEINEIMLIKVIENEFNITEKEAKEKIQEITAKYPISKKKGKILKKLESIPVYKPPGIAIEIQGKTVDNYKIRIIGSRNQTQMNEITSFVQKLLFLYQETYLEKKQSRINLINKLEKLTSIAKRRHFVKDIIIKEETDAYYSIKKMKNIDPETLGKSQDNIQYTRDCQNSGNVIRRPQQYTTEKELLEQGYTFNKATGNYERQYKLPKTNKTITLTAIKFDTKSGPIYYTCSPEINNERMFIGILSKSKGTLPCCFKKNQLESNNMTIRTKILEVLGKHTINEETSNELNSQMLYIKQYSTNKITHERLFFLPEILDNFFNLINNKIIKKSNKLELAKDGYYFLFGINVLEYKFLYTISYAVSETVNQIKNKIISVLKKDNDNKLFTSINEGNIINQFETRKNFINFIENSQQLDYNIVYDLIRYIYHINIIIFEFNKIKNDFFILCQQYINNEYPFMFLIKDERNYYIIIDVVKKEKDDKKISQKLLFNYDEPITQQILDYYYQPCMMFINQVNVIFYKKLFKLKGQIIDSNNKVIFVITDKNILLPTIYCGVDYELDIFMEKDISNYIVDIDTQLNYMKNMDWIKVISILYNDNTAKFIKVLLKTTNNFIDNEVLIPIKHTNINKIKLDILEEYNPIDMNEELFDERKFKVNIIKLKDELLSLFRLELSNYININIKYKEIIENIIKSKDSLDKKKIKLREFLNNLCKKSDFIHINKDSLDEWTHKKQKLILNFKLNNIRTLCYENENNLYCYKKKLSIIQEWLNDYIIIVSNHLINMDVNGKEILKIDKYYVSDVINSMNFTYRNNQMILKGTDFKLQYIIDQLYGEGILPNLGKKKQTHHIVTDDENEGFIEYDKYYSQKIIKNNNTILRALVNGLYYLLYKNKYPIEIINLGYNSTLQSNLVNYFKGKIVSFLRNYFIIQKNNIPKILNINKVDNDLLINIHKNYMINNYWIIIIWCFHKLLEITIIIEDINNNELFKFESKTDKKITLRISFNSYNNFPNEIFVIYYK